MTHENYVPLEIFRTYSSTQQAFEILRKVDKILPRANSGTSVGSDKKEICTKGK